MNLLSEIIPGFGVLKDADFAVVEDLFKINEYYAGDLVLKPGQICKELYFIHTGLVYAYANDETERILWYEFEGNSFTDVISFYSQLVSNHIIKVAEDKTIIASISYDDLGKLFSEHPNWAIWGTRYYQQELLRLTSYYENLRTKDASQRYQELVGSFPEILQKIPLGHIASYLGISQVSLSRIRAGKQKK